MEQLEGSEMLTKPAASVPETQACGVADVLKPPQSPSDALLSSGTAQSTDSPSLPVEIAAMQSTSSSVVPQQEAQESRTDPKSPSDIDAVGPASSQAQVQDATLSAHAQPSHTAPIVSTTPASEPGSGPVPTPQMSQTQTSTQTSDIPSLVPQTPQTALTFLLISGRRRTMSFDPDMTIGRVKELVWNAWPSEWQDERPPAPSYLRILYLGKILQDEDTLNKLSFPSSIPNPPSESRPHSHTHPPFPTIVHLSIRPYAPPTDDDLKKTKKGRRRGRGRSDAEGEGGRDAETGANEDRDAGCCGCVIC